jgi:predicted transcriptional regulator
MELNKLNTGNPDAMSYHTEELSFTVLGGIRLDGLDRLRVTLKIEVTERKFKHYLNNPELAALAIRHNIDLYNDVQVEKLTRKTAERLEIGTTHIAKAVAELTNQLEQYRLMQIEAQQKRETEKKQKKILSPEQRAQAENFLKAPDLMERTKQAIAQSGVIGEAENALRMLLIFTTRKRESPLHIISLGASGTGKTYLQEKISELIPEEDKIEITTLSDNAFYYFERNELSNKLILIEDYDGVLSVLYPIRELKSKQKITKTVTIKDPRGNTRTIHLTVEGPVCVAGCTTRESIYEDNANRSFLIFLDESAAQDERIMQYQRKRSAGKINTDEEKQIKELMQNCQRILEPITVINPYAELLKLPNEVLKPRRTNSHYLQFIEAITFYHQLQRQQKADESTGEVYIETTIEDIAEAGKLIKEILLRKSDDITGACRNYFELLKAQLQKEKQSNFTNKEVRSWLRMPLSTVKRHNLELMNCGYLKLAESKKQKGYRYEIVSYEEYNELQSRITNVLDEILEKIKQQQPNGSNLAQSKNEPTKRKSNKALNSQPKQPKEKTHLSETEGSQTPSKEITTGEQIANDEAATR